VPGQPPVFDEISLYVSNLKESRAFYVDRLGFGVEYEGGDFVVLKTGGTKILLHASSQPPEMADLIFQIRVEDVDSLHVELTKLGVRFARPPIDVSHEGDPWSPRREARLVDPDGYDIALFSLRRKV